MSDYSAVEGYADLDAANLEKQEGTARYVYDILNDRGGLTETDNILVAGCGNGSEAVSIQKIFKIKTTGVDVSLNGRNSISNLLTLEEGDLENLKYDDQAYSFVYSFHVLEHVSNPSKVLAELKRVMKDDGSLFIGFPNRNRLFAYVGTHNDVTWGQIIKWNLNDYLKRIQGKFRNEYGAHAGFSNKEFLTLSKAYFSNVELVRNQYMLNKYDSHSWLIKILISTGMSEFLFPSNYYYCKK